MPGHLSLRPRLAQREPLISLASLESILPNLPFLECPFHYFLRLSPYVISSGVDLLITNMSFCGDRRRLKSGNMLIINSLSNKPRRRSPQKSPYASESLRK